MPYGFLCRILLILPNLPNRKSQQIVVMKPFICVRLLIRDKNTKRFETRTNCVLIGNGTDDQATVRWKIID